ncbi:MAG TPA: tripartite tricarboxylate transporter substrate binding protein [Burkholderiales bacterium]|nr:tripartite tricarboxylate transporter substrate binding protein [Burkholderiales bacterium]
MRRSLGLLVLAGLVSAAHAQAPWKPERNVEILVASKAGTGPDRLARMIQKLWSEQKDMNFTTSISTRAGGGGTILWTYMTQKRGDPHYLMITSYNIVVNHIVGKSAITYTDFTPVSLLASEWIGYSVKADSPFKTIQELAAAIKADPDKYPIAVSSNAGGANHIAASLMLKAAGVDLKKAKFVIYSGNNEATISVMGGHSVMTAGSVGGIAPHFSNGSTRVLAFAAPQRVGGIFAQVPTMTEVGLPVLANNWRLVMAPKDLTPAQAAYWDEAFKRLATSDEWNKMMQSQYLTNSYLGAADLRKYLDRQYGEVRQILTDIGMAKPPGSAVTTAK